MYKGHSEKKNKMLNDPHRDEKLLIEQEPFFYAVLQRKIFIHAIPLADDNTLAAAPVPVNAKVFICWFC